MSEKISKEHARRAIKVLESLTGGIIRAESILKEYEYFRKEEKLDRILSLDQALIGLIDDRFYIRNEERYDYERNLPYYIYYGENNKIISSNYSDRYRVASISFPNAYPVKFILEIGKFVDKDDNVIRYDYAVLMREPGSDDSILLSHGGTGQVKLDSLEEALRSGFMDLVSEMISYAIQVTESSKHKFV